MFCNKENVNILTALLVKHGVCHAVVCPGSRNAPIAHNLHELETHGLMKCHPVTDERSAGFYAIGIAQATGTPTAVCVTSGSALLNLAPAVAEAKYQHIPVIVISADRPAAWIDQLDGQTLHQPDALGCMVRKCVSLPEPHDTEERWHCNRLVNEALIDCRRHSGAPVHINIPITEPLFTFNVELLPDERMTELLTTAPTGCPPQLTEAICQAEKPMLVIGQTKKDKRMQETANALSRVMPVIQEPLSGSAIPFDEALKAIGGDTEYLPDLIIYTGGTIVSKPMRKFLRTTTTAHQWRISEEGVMEDCFGHLTHIVAGRPADILPELYAVCADNKKAQAYRQLWEKALTDAESRIARYAPPYSTHFAVKTFERQLGCVDYNCHVHYANSTAIRAACIFAGHYVYCNRGVNGIEGSLSTAAGFSLATGERVFCVTGDLSFFYDRNALWNTRLRGNLRILLLNDGGGGIFNSLPGLGGSPALGEYIAAHHDTSARGICADHGMTYLQATDMQESETAIGWLIHSADEPRPMLAEIMLPAKD